MTNTPLTRTPSTVISSLLTVALLSLFFASAAEAVKRESEINGTAIGLFCAAGLNSDDWKEWCTDTYMTSDKAVCAESCCEQGAVEAAGGEGSTDDDFLDVLRICELLVIEHAFAGEGGPVVETTYEGFTDRPGRDYRSFDLDQPDARLCQSQCVIEARCAAWSYVEPGLQGPKARCWLKDTVPAPRQHDRVTSGVKISVEPGMGRDGHDYRSLDLPTGSTSEFCHSICISEAPRCRAWTYVAPGIQGSQARCWLKDRVPAPAEKDGRISGVVGAQLVEFVVVPPPAPGPTPTPIRCVNVDRPRLKLQGLTRAPGSHRLTLQGAADFSFPFQVPPDPRASGIRIEILDADGAVVADASIPAGDFDASRKEGWKVNRKGTAYSWQSRAGIDGLDKASLRWGSRSDPGRIKFSVRGKRGHYLVDPAALPLRARLYIAGAALCADAAFGAPDGACTDSGDSVRCK